MRMELLVHGAITELLNMGELHQGAYSRLGFVSWFNRYSNGRRDNMKCMGWVNESFALFDFCLYWEVGGFQRFKVPNGVPGQNPSIPGRYLA